MSMFTLTISCLTTYNLPWFVDLTFQVPMQYCCLQHRTLLSSTVSSTTGCCFFFGFISSFFLELFIHWSPVAYWAPSNLGSSFFSVLSFCLFILFMGFSRQEYWSGLPFPSPVDHILSGLFTMTRPSWVALHGMAQFHWVSLSCVWSMWSDCLVFCGCGFQSVCPLMEKDETFIEASWWGNWVFFWWVGSGLVQFSRSVLWLFATPWTAAFQAPPSRGFPGKSTGVGCHCA